MKKNIFMLLLSLFLCGAYVTTNNAKTTQENDLNKIIDRERKNTTTTFLSNDATYYFSNLTQNFAKNYKGTCTYVATAMLLQYYDTFWDDNIVPAQYEVVSATTEDINARTSSPGIRTDKIPGLTDLQAQQLTNLQYYDYMRSMSDSYFQHRLLQIMDDDFEFEYITMASEACFASITESGRKELIDHYLQNYVGYSESAYTLEIFGTDFGQESSTDVRNYIINKVKKGIPVLACVNSYASYHACIAYDYDQSTGTIYFHWGDLEPDTHYGILSGSSVQFKSAMTLSFHNSHTHTDNYKKIVNGNVYSYCGCHLSTHRHVAHTFAQLNGEYHIEYCYCGNYSRQDLHTCYGNTGRYEPCSECGTIVDLWNVGTNAIIREEQPEIA